MARSARLETCRIMVFLSFRHSLTLTLDFSCKGSIAVGIKRRDFGAPIEAARTRGLWVVREPDWLALSNWSITMAKKVIKTRKTVPSTKSQQIVALLSRPNGASLPELMKATDWQAHSVRGFMAGTLKKKDVEVSSSREQGKDRRYRIVEKA